MSKSHPEAVKKVEKNIEDYTKKNPRVPGGKMGVKKEEVTFQQFQEKCWPGYEKKGMKTMFGKRYPNCVKKKK